MDIHTKNKIAVIALLAVSILASLAISRMDNKTKIGYGNACYTLSTTLSYIRA